LNSSPSANWAARLWWALIRFGFRLLYNELAWTYDLVSWGVSLGYWRTWQRTGLAYLDARPGDRILELAHGTGNFQCDLTTSGYCPVGLDISRAMGRIARRRLRRSGAPARLVRGDASRLPFASESFRAVISTFPTEFIARRDTLSEAYRVLAPGGRLVIVPIAVFTPSGAATRFLEWLYRATGQRGPWPKGVGEIMSEIGFKVSLHTENLDTSQAVIVVANKPEV
jgi:ubiquinone/menaquinone biosynthesis C-methylase UbiE